MDIEDLPKVRSTRDQVERALSQLILEQQPGDQLPPEPVLARQLGVSRPTLREVLRTFAERGLLVQRQGVGTFVTSRLPVLETGLEVLESLERMTERMHLATRMTHLEVVERQATERELEGLDRDAPTAVLVVDRVIEVEEGEVPDFRPVADLRDVVPLEVLDRSDVEEGFRGSVLDILLSKGTPALSISKTQILAELTVQDDVLRLQVEQGAPLLVLIAQLFSYDEHVVDYSVSRFVPGYFRFHVMRRVVT